MAKKFPGWVELDPDMAQPTKGDVVLSALQIKEGMAPDTAEFHCTFQRNYKNTYANLYAHLGSGYCFYRRIHGPTEEDGSAGSWIPLADDAILQPGDIVAKPDFVPSGDLLPRSSIGGGRYLTCEPPPYGYGNGKYTSRDVNEGFGAPLVAWRFQPLGAAACTTPRRRRPPHPIYSEPLPLP